MDPASAFDTKVELLLVGSGQLEVPQEWTILAGQTSATFQIKAIQDAYMEAPAQVQVLARVTGYTWASATIGVIDDDVWPLSITLDATAVSEASAGTQLRGTVTRTGPTDRRQWVDLTSSDPTAAVVQSSVVIPAGSPRRPLQHRRRERRQSRWHAAHDPDGLPGR